MVTFYTVFCCLYLCTQDYLFLSSTMKDVLSPSDLDAFYFFMFNRFV